MLSYKTKTNQAWAANAPLEIWRVSRNKKGEPVKEKVNRSEIADLKARLDDVLLSGKIPRNHKNRGGLLISLTRASAALSLEVPLVPVNLVERLELSIEEISALLVELKKYRGAVDVINQTHKLGEGVVDVLPVEILETFKVVPLTPISGIALIRMQKLLEAWYRAVQKLPRTEPNAPTDDVTREIVRYAVEFFSGHSAKKPSTYRSNPVQTFAVHFHKWITGVDRESLDWHVREVLEEMGAVSAKRAKSRTVGKSPKNADLTG
jgi:hypothetical protein